MGYTNQRKALLAESVACAKAQGWHGTRAWLGNHDRFQGTCSRGHGDGGGVVLQTPEMQGAV